MKATNAPKTRRTRDSRIWNSPLTTGSRRSLMSIGL